MLIHPPWSELMHLHKAQSLLSWRFLGACATCVPIDAKRLSCSLRTSSRVSPIRVLTHFLLQYYPFTFWGLHLEEAFFLLRFSSSRERLPTSRLLTETPLVRALSACLLSCLHPPSEPTEVESGDAYTLTLVGTLFVLDPSPGYRSVFQR